MGNSSATATANGIGFGGLLTIVLIVLKLLKLITISWWWVWAPMWIPLALFIVACAALGLCATIISIMDAQAKRKKWAGKS